MSGCLTHPPYLLHQLEKVSLCLPDPPVSSLETDWGSEELSVPELVAGLAVDWLSVMIWLRGAVSCGCSPGRVWKLGQSELLKTQSRTLEQAFASCMRNQLLNYVSG